MKERFEKDGRPQLVEALKRQELVAGNAKLTEALIKRGALVEYQKGDKLIVEGGEDNDIYFLISESVAVVVKGNDTRRLKWQDPLTIAERRPKGSTSSSDADAERAIVHRIVMPPPVILDS